MKEYSAYTLSELIGIKYPIIMAPMFLVSNEAMLIEAANCGITGAIPALNYRNEDLFEEGLKVLDQSARPFGINLIVNKSNFRFKEQLRLCCEAKVDYIITSLGSPEETIREAHKAGIKVFCDVTDLKYAQKVEAQGADAIIAVNNEAGGHAGPQSKEALIRELKANCDIPVISAGGVGDKASLDEVLDMGADGVSVGTIFIASDEASVSEDYKNAIIEYGEDDIVLTTKLSGTPCTVINTDYVKELGTEQNHLERILNKNRRIKKWFKALTFIRGMRRLKDAAFGATYKTVWCAGPSVKYVDSVRPIKGIVNDLTQKNE